MRNSIGMAPSRRPPRYAPTPALIVAGRRAGGDRALVERGGQTDTRRDAGKRGVIPTGGDPRREYTGGRRVTLPGPPRRSGSRASGGDRAARKSRATSS